MEDNEPTQTRLEFPCILVVGDPFAAAIFADKLSPFPVLLAANATEAGEQLMLKSPLVVVVGGQGAKHTMDSLADLARAVAAEVVLLADLGVADQATSQLEKIIYRADEKRKRGA